MSDLADYLQWKRDAAELAALRVEVVQLREALRVTRVKLNTARNRGNYYKAKLGIKKPVTKQTQIIELMENGMRNCDIMRLGFTEVSVIRARKLFKEATTP